MADAPSGDVTVRRRQRKHAAKVQARAEVEAINTWLHGGEDCGKTEPMATYHHTAKCPCGRIEVEIRYDPREPPTPMPWPPDRVREAAASATKVCGKCFVDAMRQNRPIHGGSPR